MTAIDDSAPAAAAEPTVPRDAIINAPSQQAVAGMSLIG